MKLTTVTVSFARTQSLGNYSNVKPSITLTAELEDGDDPDAAKTALYAEARAFVEEAVDLAIEADGDAAKFDQTSPRYHVIRSRTSPAYGDHGPLITPPVVAIVPASRLDGVPGDNAYNTETYRPVRWGHAKKIAADALDKIEPGALLILCDDGDLSRLPQRPTPPLDPATGSNAPDGTSVIAGSRVSDDDFDGYGDEDDENDEDY